MLFSMFTIIVYFYIYLNIFKMKKKNIPLSNNKFIYNGGEIEMTKSLKKKI